MLFYIIFISYKIGYSGLIEHILLLQLSFIIIFVIFVLVCTDLIDFFHGIYIINCKNRHNLGILLKIPCFVLQLNNHVTSHATSFGIEDIYSVIYEFLVHIVFVCYLLYLFRDSIFYFEVATVLLKREITWHLGSSIKSIHLRVI